MLLSFDDYRKLAGRGQSLLDALAMPGGEDIDLEPHLLFGSLVKPMDVGSAHPLDTSFLPKQRR